MKKILFILIIVLSGCSETDLKDLFKNPTSNPTVTNYNDNGSYKKDTTKTLPKPDTTKTIVPTTETYPEIYMGGGKFSLYNCIINPSNTTPNINNKWVFYDYDIIVISAISQVEVVKNDTVCVNSFSNQTLLNGVFLMKQDYDNTSKDRRFIKGKTTWTINNNEITFNDGSINKFEFNRNYISFLNQYGTKYCSDFYCIGNASFMSLLSTNIVTNLSYSNGSRDKAVTVNILLKFKKVGDTVNEAPKTNCVIGDDNMIKINGDYQNTPKDRRFIIGYTTWEFEGTQVSCDFDYESGYGLRPTHKLYFVDFVGTKVVNKSSVGLMTINNSDVGSKTTYTMTTNNEGDAMPPSLMSLTYNDGKNVVQLKFMR